MSAKLLKHEYLRTRAQVGIIFAIAVGLGLAGAILGLIKSPLNPAPVLQVLAITLVIPAVQIYLGIENWRNSYKRQGYFTQMIPARGSTIYGAKLLWALIVTFAGFIIAILLTTLLVVTNGFTSEMAKFLSYISLEWWIWLLVAIFVISSLVLLPFIFHFLASICAREPLNRWGLGGPALMGVILYIVLQVLMMLSFFILPFAITSNGVGASLSVINPTEFFTANGLDVIMPIGWIFVYPIVEIVLGFWTRYLWNRGASLN